MRNDQFGSQVNVVLNLRSVVGNRDVGRSVTPRTRVITCQASIVHPWSHVLCGRLQPETRLTRLQICLKSNQEVGVPCTKP